jgi:hypothetical protein
MCLTDILQLCSVPPLRTANHMEWQRNLNSNESGKALAPPLHYLGYLSTYGATIHIPTAVVLHVQEK